MRRHGYTAKGTPRWRCASCGATAVRTRPDARGRHERGILFAWLQGKRTLGEIAGTRKVTRQALWKRFRSLFAATLPWKPPQAIRVLVLDGTYIHRRILMVLVALADKQRLAWAFAPKETAAAWGDLLIRLPRPRVLACDGHPGLLAAIKALWPDTAIQRCHFHVLKLARAYLSRSPKTEAGRALWALVLTLPYVRTKRSAERFRRAFADWETRYDAFLAEKTFGMTASGRKTWWYTHRKLRGARTLVRKALPHLFTFLDHPGTPNTTNHVEGGVNATIADALRDHRGLREHQKPLLVSAVLAKINTKKATRKFT